MMYKVQVAVCFQIRTQHTKQCEHHVQFVKVKLGGM